MKWKIVGLLIVCCLFFAGGATGQQDTTFNVTNEGSSAYNIDGQTNPDLNLTPGTTYTFNVSASGHPFYLRYDNGTVYENVTVSDGGTSTETGTLTVTIPEGFDHDLYYQCDIHSSMTGEAYSTGSTQSTDGDTPTSSPTPTPTSVNASSGDSGPPLRIIGVTVLIALLVAGGIFYATSRDTDWVE
jgi:hypothetical protein